MEPFGACGHNHWMTKLQVYVVILAAIVLGVACSPGLNLMAQTSAPVEPTPKFEVASIRQNTSGDNKMASQILPGGRYNAINIPPRLLIINSYRLQAQQLVGGPEWIFSERFDIIAKAEGDLGPPVERDRPSRLQLMIRALLEERFKLKVHREPREIPIYALVFARADGRLGRKAHTFRPSTATRTEPRGSNRRAQNH